MAPGPAGDLGLGPERAWRSGMKDNLVLLTGNAHPDLAKKISRIMDVPLGEIVVKKFSDDETFCRIYTNIRKRDVYIIQPTSKPVNDNLMELLIIIDACKRSSCRSITAVIPYYGYSRTDKKDQPRVPITAKLVADLLTVAGADHIITIDLHAEAIQGFFDIQVDHLYGLPVFINFLKKTMKKDKLVIVSPDAGGVARARAYAKRLGAELAIIDKRRKGNEDQTEILHVIGEVEGKNCVLVDDIIDTAGSITKAAKVLKEKGAHRVHALAVHAVLSGPAMERLSESPIEKVIVTDTVPIDPAKKIAKIEVLSVAGLLAETIKRSYQGDSVSSLFV
jgi:ribose-phosphate pyrophosphokinase